MREADTPVRWSVAELNRYIDDGYIDMSERTGAVVATRTINCPAQAHFIALDSDCLYPIAAKDVASDLPIDPVHWSFLDSVDDVWVRLAGPRPDFYAMFGLREFIIYPAYETAGTIEMILSVVPTGLATDSAEPDLPEEYHYGLVHYVHGRALAKDAHGDDAGPRFGRARRQLGFYQEALNGLGLWTFDRHKHIAKAVYGEHYRMPTVDSFGVVTE